MKLNNLFKKKNTDNGEVKPTTSKKKLSKQAIWNIVCFCILGLTHIAIILAIILSFRYYSIYPSIFGSIVAIVICLLIIIDIVFFVGFNHKDIGLKLVSCILAGFIFIGGTIGTYFVAKANGIVDSVLVGEESKYETFSGVLVCYDKNHKFSTLEELNGMTVGMLAETSNGVSYIAKSHLKDAKIDYGVVEYKTNTELVQALIDGDIDAMAITAAYRSIYSAERDENSPFAKYLENFVDFYSFEQELKTNSDRKAKNVTTDPFNVLLIGYSRTEIGSSVGLADSIIVATINPQTYTVSMMSIARDSFVPIPCYGGEYDKINSGRSTSRACFIETVENFLGMDMDYYMELDYQGLVEIVDTIGGVKITNPVEFELDGIYVPEGTFNAGGWQALEFCRERHHMPNGDFDRQQHQKEVIIAIAKKFIESGDVTLALDALNNASNWMSTDLSLNQLTTIFNMLLNTKNYTGLDTFDLIDFQTLRMTGDGGIKYYSYSMHLPLWVYLIYQGSYDESMAHLNDVMGNYSSLNQARSFGFSMQNQYVRPLLYSLTYPDVFMFSPDPMPDYWPDLSGLSVAEAMEWANSKGIDLTISETISADDPRYIPELEGLVCDQSVRYGSLVSENKAGTIIVMGNAEIDESLLVPDMVGWRVDDAKDWAEENDVEWGTDDAEGVVTEQSCKEGTLIKACTLLEVEYEVSVTITGEADPSYAGSVTGGGEVVKGSKVTLKAVPNSGYRFDKWDDGTKTNEITIVAEEDETYVAYFVVDLSGLKKGDEIDPELSYVEATTKKTIEEKDLFEKESYYSPCIITSVDEKNGIVKCSRDYHKGTKVEFVPYSEPCDVSEECEGYTKDETREGTWACTVTYTSPTDSSCSCTFTPNEETPEEEPEVVE